MDNNKIDPNSRDYDLNAIEPDERFTQTTKEFWVTMGVYLAYMVLMIGNLFLVGNSDAGQNTFVFGLPLWIFLEIVIIIAMVVSVEIVSNFVYRDMDITPHGEIKK